MPASLPTRVVLSRLADWKAFERLTADLLEREGFTLLSEPGVDRSGADLVAEEVVISHSGARRRIRWQVQCKHYAGSSRSVGRKEVEEAIYCFASRTEDGLLLVTTTDLSEDAERVLQTFATTAGSHRFVRAWNVRELENRLLLHPALLRKYGLGAPVSEAAPDAFEDLPFQDKSVLVVSDSGAMAHDLVGRLRSRCERLDVISVWQYADPERCELLFGSRLRDTHDLVLFFLGDSFGFRLPTPLIRKLRDCADAGTGLVLFPFFAWTVNRRQYASIADAIPVLLNPYPDHSWLKASRLLAAGDLSFLNDESFIENQATVFRSIRPHPVVEGLPDEFEVIHTYEFLHAKPGATVLMEDSAGTPLVVEHPASPRTLYVNSCTHSCLSTAQIQSPIGSSHEFALLLRNVMARGLGLI
jgi:hypothetical protein